MPSKKSSSAAVRSAASDRKCAEECELEREKKEQEIKEKAFDAKFCDARQIAENFDNTEIKETIANGDAEIICITVIFELGTYSYPSRYCERGMWVAARKNVYVWCKKYKKEYSELCRTLDWWCAKNSGSSGLNPRINYCEDYSKDCWKFSYNISYYQPQKDSNISVEFTIADALYEFYRQFSNKYYYYFVKSVITLPTAH